MDWSTEIELDVDYAYYEGRPQIVNWSQGIFEPEEQEEVEILSVTCNGKDFSEFMTLKNCDELHDACLQHAHETAEDDACAKAEAEYESRREYANGYHREAA